MVLVCKVESTHVQFKLSEGDLLVLGMPMQDGSATDATVQIFGLVTFVTKLKVDGRLENTNNKLKVHIKVVYRSFMLGNRILKIKVLTSLISAQRQLSCFQSLTKSILARDILRPRTNTFTIRHNNSHYTDIAKTNYNESQLQAVYGTSQAALESYPLPRICMVQGPPGTGKSHTIVGIVENILIGQRNLPTSLEKNRILLCAPSNAGVDQLMRRLVHHLISISRNKYNSNFNCGDFNVVRVGRHSSIHPDVLKYSLDDVVKSRLAKEVARVSTDAVSLIKKQLEDLDTMIGDAEKICCSLKLQGNISELTVAEAERDKLQNQRNELEKANRKQ
ncbi:putative helicase senataxin, partial [Saccoglossus kowalevskii]